MRTRTVARETLVDVLAGSSIRLQTKPSRTLAVVGSFGIHAAVSARVKTLVALVHVAASTLVLLQFESFRATATCFLVVSLVRVRAAAIVGRSTASQIFVQPPSGWTSTVEPTDGVHALVRAVVLQSLTLVDVLARAFLLGERVSVGTRALVRSFEVHATLGTIVASIGAFVDVHATFTALREFQSCRTLADVRPFLVVPAGEAAVVRHSSTLVDVLAGRAVFAYPVS